MLDDDSIGAQLDHEAAGVLDAGTGDEELIAAVEQNDQIIKLTAGDGDVADKINEVERIGAGGMFGGDGELVLGNGENAHLDASQVPDENAAGGVEVWSSTDCGDASPGANLESIFETGCAVVEDVVIGEVQYLDASGFDTAARFTKHRTGLENRRQGFDERAFQVGEAQAGLLEFG